MNNPKNIDKLAKIEELIKNQEKAYEECQKDNVGLSILYNLIFMQIKYPDIPFDKSLYQKIKFLIKLYVNISIIEDYGYDVISNTKILELIQHLNSNQQISILHYFSSIVSTYLPDYDKTWIIKEINISEFDNITKSFNWRQFYKAILLYASISIQRLIISLIIIIFFVYIILLPSINPQFALFEIHYVSYSKQFLLNHLFNVLALLSNIKDTCEIKPINYLGLLFIIIGKIFYIILIINFIYKKIIDGINIK
jgi:hypothetical protein